MTERGAVTRTGRYLGTALCVLALLCWTPGASARFIIDAVPGGLVEIPLVSADQPRPEAYFGQRRIMVTRFADRWEGVVGLPLTMVPGTYVIQVRLENSESSNDENFEDRIFTVYPGRRAGRRTATLPGPPPEALTTDFTWRGSLDAGLPLKAPVRTAARPTFGRLRQQAEGGTAYADYAVFNIARDMPVATPGAGRVAATLAHESGAYVWIDHGMGLYSRLGPVSDTALNESDQIEAGQVIGRIRLDEDDTPRPLYLSVFLNGAAVNPALIFDMEIRAAGDDEDSP